MIVVGHQKSPLHDFMEGLGVVLLACGFDRLTEQPTPGPSRKAGRGEI